ncbi:MAG TPA: S53 family peptidase [Burkholderiaceae bacterium]
MKFRSNAKMLPIAAMLAAAFGVGSQASAATMVQTRTRTPDFTDAVPAETMQAGESIHIAVTLQVRNKPALDELTAAIAAGQSSRVLSSEEFKRQFAPTQDQVDAVVAHLRKSGFVNIDVAENNMLVTADGTSGTARDAFGVEMRHFVKDGVRSYANTNDPVVPEELGNIILSVHGLQTMHRMHRMMVKSDMRNTAVKEATGSAVGHNPTAWPTIYNATGLPTAADTSIGIITAGSLKQTMADLAAFVKKQNLAMPATSTVNVGGTGVSTSSGPTEWDIDSQDSLGAAGGAVKSMIFYNAVALTDADMTSMFNRAVSDNKAKVINVSLGECESSAKSDGAEASDDQIFQAGVAQGQTFAVASGDTGSYECGGKTSKQSYPAVSPYVIAVGGTKVLTTPAGAWASETVWTCTTPSGCSRSGTGGSGGGVSATETAPTWQKSSGVLGSSTKRGVPDIAFAGDPSSGAICIVNGASAQWGGTSLATPIFVGFWARIQSAHSNSLAFPASAIYKYGAANESTLFHDITSGSNGGYSAKTGWDYTTGFGSIDVGNLYRFISAHSGF